MFSIDPIDIANKLNISVDSYDKQNIPLIIDIENGQYKIKYNNELDNFFKNFVISHAIAHIKFSHIDKFPHIEDYENFNIHPDNVIDIEANDYAIELLMPKDKIDFLLYEKGITDIREIAKLLNVTYTAMVYRLQMLGYIS